MPTASVLPAVVAAAVLLALVDVSSAQTTYTVSVSSETAQQCGSAPVSGSSEQAWDLVWQAQHKDSAGADVLLGNVEFSEWLYCTGFDLTGPLSAAWSSVPVAQYVLGARAMFAESGDLYFSVIDNNATGSASNYHFLPSTSDWDDRRVVQATYSGISMMVGDLASSQVGMRVHAEAYPPTPTPLAVDSMYMEAIFSVDADVTDISPASAKQGDTITVTGTFYDLREFGRSVTCLFNDTTTHETHRVDVASLTSSAVTCVVPTSFPETGEGRDVRVSVGLDSTHDIDRTHVFTMFDETDGGTDKPQFPLETVLYAGGAGLAVLVVSVTIVMSRSSDRLSVQSVGKSTTDIAASDKPTPGTAGSDKPAMQSAPSGTSGASSGPVAASTSSQRNRSRKGRGGKGSVKSGRQRGGRSPTADRKPSAHQMDRASLKTEVPESSYHSVPIAEFQYARTSTRTLHSVQSAQAPHIVDQEPRRQ